MKSDQKDLQIFFEELETKGLQEIKEIGAREKYRLIERQKEHTARNIHSLKFEIFISIKMGNREEEKKEKARLHHLKDLFFELIEIQLDIMGREFTPEDSSKTGKIKETPDKEEYWQRYIT